MHVHARENTFHNLEDYIDEVMTHTRAKIDTIPRNSVAELETYINEKWHPAFKGLNTPYPWKGLTSYDIAGPIIRVDMPMISDDNGIPVEKKIFEFEDVPEGYHAIVAAWLRIIQEHDNIYAREHFSDIFQRIKSALEALDCEGFINLNPELLADEILAQSVDMPYYAYWPEFLDHDNNVYCTRKKHHLEKALFPDQYESLARHSLNPVYMDSRKDDLIALGIAERLDIWIAERNSTFEGKCIKPIHGTRSANVLRFPFDATPEEKLRFFHHFDEISKEDQCDYLIMDDVPPTRIELVGINYDVIGRYYFLIDPEETQYRFLTAITTAAPTDTVRGGAVHGSRDDAIFWAIKVADE